jgi:hypothetical protein
MRKINVKNDSNTLLNYSYYKGINNCSFRLKLS